MISVCIYLEMHSCISARGLAETVDSHMNVKTTSDYKTSEDFVCFLSTSAIRAIDLQSKSLSESSSVLTTSWCKVMLPADKDNSNQ